MNYIHEYFMLNYWVLFPIIVFGAALTCICAISRNPNSKPYIVIGLLISFPLSSLAKNLENDKKLKNLELYSHMEKVGFVSDSIYERFGCYPTSVDAMQNIDVFNSPSGNSCRKENVTTDREWFTSYMNDAKTEDNHFVLDHIITGVKGEIVQEYGALIYKLKNVTKPYLYNVYYICKKYKDDEKSANLLTTALLSEKNQCGIKDDKYPVVYIGKRF